VPVTASLNTYASWDNGTNTYATLEAAPTYGVLEGARLQITRTLPSSGSLLIGRLWSMSFGGTLTPTGDPTKSASHRFTGALASSAVVLVGKIFTRALAGSLGSSGVVARVRMRVLNIAGVTTPAGDVTLRLLNRFYVSFGGGLWPLGELRVRVTRAPWPPLGTASRTSPPSLVGASSSSAPDLQPAPKPTWPPFNAQPR